MAKQSVCYRQIKACSVLNPALPPDFFFNFLFLEKKTYFYKNLGFYKNIKIFKGDTENRCPLLIIRFNSLLLPVTNKIRNILFKSVNISSYC